MTTEQSDWLDDERAGRHAPPKPPAQVPNGGVGLKPATEYHVNINGGEPTVLTTEESDRLGKRLSDIGALRTRHHAGESVVWVNAPLEVVIDEIRRVTDAEEHTHHTREARDQCAAGDHQYAKLLDEAAEREKTTQATMAEEPIENRLRRAWLNGFRDGVDRASYAATESTGRWDY
jgi:hypothetical protein